MVSKHLVSFLVVILVLTTFSIGKSNAVILNMGSDDISHAIKYGKENKGTLLGDFAKQWTVNLGKEIGWATLYTGFHNLAYKSRKASIEHKELTPNEIDKALEMSKDLTFTVSILGDYMDFAREYHAMLKLGKDLIAPSYEYVPEYAESSEFWPESPDSVAGCVFKFPIDGIKDDSLVTLILRPFDGDVLQFSFDLSKMK